MKASSLFLLGTFFLFSHTAFADWGPPVTHVCKKQINSYVEQTLNTEVESIHFYFDHDNRSDNNTAWVRVASCSGWVVFRLSTNEMNCQMAHYGRIPNYISGVYMRGDCRE